MSLDDKETWENKNKGDVWIETLDISGNLVPTRISAGSKVHITTKERKLNQEKAYGPEGDLFMNGVLSVVDIVDTAEDYEEIKSNPHTKSEKEIKEILALNANQIKKEIAEITSFPVISRMKEMIENSEAENVTVAKKNAVEARYDELNPSKTGKLFEDWDTEASKKVKQL